MSDRLEETRLALLRVHRALIDLERADYERRNGAIGGPEFLRLLLEDLRYAWLRPLSELVIAIDEAQSEAARDGGPVPDARVAELRGAARELVSPPSPGTAFGRRYAAALQREPDVVVAHGALARALAG